MTEGRACEVCGGRDFKEIAALDAGTRVFRCRACGLYVVDPVRRWDKAKDDFSQLDLESWIGYMEGFRRGQYRKDLEVIGKYKSAGKLLDVGCACGFFLDDAAKRGFEVRGIEPAHTAVEYARKRFHADVLEGELGSVDVGAEGFDVVSMFAVLEHTAAPTEVVAKLHRLLKPGGLAVVKVPRSDALVPWLIYSAYRWTFGRVAAPLRSLYEWSFQYPHLFHFSTRTLPALLKKVGFEVLEYRTEGSINLEQFNARLKLVSKGEDLGWVKGRLSRFAISLLVRLAGALGLEDDLIVYARKPGGAAVKP